jgi:hypothetical protein
MRYLGFILLAACTAKSDVDADAGVASSEDSGSTSAPSHGTTTSSTSSSSSSSTGVDVEEGDEPQMDLPSSPDLPRVACERTGPLVAEGLEVSTPLGPIEVASAFWGWNYCCVEAPFILLTAQNSVEATNSLDFHFHDAPPSVGILTANADEHGRWRGDVDARLWATTEPGESVDREGLTATFVRSLREATTPSLELAFAIDEGIWQLSGTVVAEYCPGLDTPVCPCE